MVALDLPPTGYLWRITKPKQAENKATIYTLQKYTLLRGFFYNCLAVRDSAGISK